jgi:hypothetical protein
LFDLGQSFQQYTVAWLLLSSVLGGIVGATVKFAFEDIIRPSLGWRRDTAKIARQYTTPLVRSAEALERRINILVRNERERWYVADEYFRVSTLYVFGEYLAWNKVLEAKFGFLPFESSRKGRQFNERLRGVLGALSSHSYFRHLNDPVSVDRSSVPRFMLSAVGEAMSGSGQRDLPITFIDFTLRFGQDEQFRRWFKELDEFLAGANLDDALRWDRLIVTAANLRALVRHLDPHGRQVTKRKMVNLQLLKDADIKARVESEFPDLVSGLFCCFRGWMTGAV